MYSGLKLWNGLITGLMAITVNTLLLKCSPLLHIKAEGGGLLKLLLKAGRYITGQPAFLHGFSIKRPFHFIQQHGQPTSTAELFTRFARNYKSS